METNLLPRRIRETEVPLCRLLLFVSISVLFFGLMFLTLIRSPPGDTSRVYLCQTSQQMVECQGEDDGTTCSAIVDEYTGQLGVPCVESACGYKLAAGIDVSVFGSADPLVDDGTAKSVKGGFMVFWSVVPYALMLGLLLSLLLCGDTCTVSFIFLLAFVAVVNELIFKHIFSQHRPHGSCLYFGSYGMPSGHAATSIGMLGNALLETWVDRPDFTLVKKAVLSSVSIFFLAVVPYSRVYLHDHFRQQVGAGAAEGLVVAMLWFVFTYGVARERLDGWVDHRLCKCYGIRNNYRNGEPYLPGWLRRRLGAAEPAETDYGAGDVEMGM